MSMLCSAVSVALPTVGDAALAGPVAAHVETCMACRREVLRYRTMHSGLSSLTPERHRAPHGFTSAVMADLGPVMLRSPDQRRDPRVPVAAAVMATAAAGTAVLFKLYRDRAA